MGETTFLIIIIIEQITSMLPAIVCSVKYRDFTLDLKIFTWHFIFIGIMQVIFIILWIIKINNLFILHLYVVEQVVMLSLFYGHLLNEQLKKSWIYTVIVAFIIFAIANAIWLQPLTTNPTNTKLVQVAIVCFYVILTLYIRAKQVVPPRFIDGRDFKLNRVTLACINIGLMISCVASLVVYTISNDLLDPKLHALALKTWGTLAVANIISNIFICIGLLYFKRPAEEPVVD